MGNFVFQDLEHFPKTVWREGDPPLVNSVPPIAPESKPAESGPTWPRVLARLWYTCFASIHLAILWTLLTAPDEYCTSPLQPIGAFIGPWVLWAITILVYSKTH